MLSKLSCINIVYIYSLQRGERHIQVKINGWSDVNMFIKFDSVSIFDQGSKCIPHNSVQNAGG